MSKPSRESLDDLDALLDDIEREGKPSLPLATRLTNDHPGVDMVHAAWATATDESKARILFAGAGRAFVISLREMIRYANCGSSLNENVTPVSVAFSGCKWSLYVNDKMRHRIAVIWCVRDMAHQTAVWTIREAIDVIAGGKCPKTLEELIEERKREL